MELVEGFESRPPKAVTFRVERDKEIQEVPELKNCRKPYHDSAVVRQKEEMSAVLTASLEDSTTSGVLVGREEEMGGVEKKSSSGVLAGEPFQHVNQNCGCSQVENEVERDSMDWLMDDEATGRG